MTKRTCMYARYSTDLQSASSIEDQLRLCAQKAASEGWTVQATYSDAAISGASLVRPGIQSLIQAAMQRDFDILLCEALDRLSRNLSDIAGLYQQLEFAGVRIVTLAEGEISTMHIGLKGTMNALFLKDLADKTRRGLRGKVENGLSGGGVPYGYRVVKSGNTRGKREINDEQAAIIRRIFCEYAHENKSPKAIAAQLNMESVPSPSGKSWSQSTLNGNRHRGTGILNNDLYQGQLIWNRQKFMKAPTSGKRVPRFNPESEWIRQSVPKLAIVPDDLWSAAKARQKKLDQKTAYLGAKKRPQYLLSGLLECGVCKGGYSKINAERYGCSSARNKGESICANTITIKRTMLESSVLDALEARLMRDELMEVFCTEYARHMQTLICAQNAARGQYKTEQAKCAREKENIIQAIKDGVPAALLKDELDRLTAREAELKGLMAAQSEEPPTMLHPSMAGRYRQEVVALRHSLTNQDGTGEAREHVRGLVEKIVLTPRSDMARLAVDLYGDLAEILKMTIIKPAKKQPDLVTANDNYLFGSSVQLVAGVGFEPTTFGL